MDFVSEQIIETVTTDLGTSSEFKAVVSDFKNKQPVLLAYLFSRNFNLLTQEEREYMMFLALVVWKASHTTNPEIVPVSQELVEDLEENNWDLLQRGSSRIFKERIDPFFEDYPQEDLLAFVEDSLAHDDDSDVTKEGREYIFVALKTIIDCMEATQNV